jgi:hypothetical protein
MSSNSAAFESATRRSSNYRLVTLFLPHPLARPTLPNSSLGFPCNIPQKCLLIRLYNGKDCDLYQSCEGALGFCLPFCLVFFCILIISPEAFYIFSVLSVGVLYMCGWAGVALLCADFQHSPSCVCGEFCSFDGDLEDTWSTCI